MATFRTMTLRRPITNDTATATRPTGHRNPAKPLSPFTRPPVALGDGIVVAEEQRAADEAGDDDLGEGAHDEVGLFN